MEQGSEKATALEVPVPDQIQGFYWKSLGSLRQGSRFTTERFLNGLDVPAILVSGRTTLIPKGSEELEKPSKYRPIACLNVHYKLLTTMTSDIISKVVTVLPQEQRAMTSSSGC